MAYQSIHDAHGKLVQAVRDLTKPGFAPIPITLVSVADEIESQMVVFDGTKFAKDEVAKRLRIAADFLDTQP